jgi:hypothetical protein
MKTLSLVIIATVIISLQGRAQQNTAFIQWSWLLGEWKGEGSGQPGKGGGTFSFLPDLDNHVLIRKSHSEYPASANNQAVIHDDLMVVYADNTGNPTKAIYFDNEGHTINYTVTYIGMEIILLSDKVPGVPIFRLTYSQLEDNKVNTKFEMSQDGENFITYIEGISNRIN